MNEPFSGYKIVIEKQSRWATLAYGVCYVVGLCAVSLASVALVTAWVVIVYRLARAVVRVMLP